MSALPSNHFVEALAGGGLLALCLLYLSRRSREAESPVPDYAGGALASGGDAFASGGALASGEYPRAYRLTALWRAGMALLGGILLLVSLAAAWGLGAIAADAHDSVAILFVVFILAFIAAIAAFYIADALKSSIVLTADHLEIRELWRVRRIPRSDIETRQVLHSPNSPAVLILNLKEPNNRKVKVTLLWDADSAWQAWFAAIPDVDAQAAKAFEAAVEANVQLGASPVERQQKLNSARRVARFAIWTNVGLIAWAYIYPHPYELVIFVLTALPWVAVGIMARSPGLYTLNAPRGSGQPDLTVLLISPGFLLMLRAFMDVHILDWQRLLLWAAVVAAALMGSILWALPSAREKLGMAALTLALVLAYGYGVCALGDAVLDRSGGSTYPTTVYGKHVTSGRNKRPMLRLGSWGPRATQDEVAVSWDLYRSTNVGDAVCVRLYPGALAIPWYRVSGCQP